MTKKAVPISGKEKKELIRQLKGIIPSIDSILTKKAMVTKYLVPEGEIYTLEQTPILLRVKGYLIPSLKLVQKVETKLPKVKVDTGAIRFVTNGADVMRPGITWIDSEVVENEPVLIVEETKESPLAIGIAKFDAVDMNAMENGKVIRTIHHLTDKFWSFVP
ncbi:MAG: hypothetical protein D6732_20830 [Methanobacteriota archaeon]|nr:MAG: hypothetical protein D6732_20830 [Euryarchaeota archaeon]